MIRTLRKNGTELFAVVALIVVAAGVSGYILDKQRLRFPFFDDKPFVLYAELATAQAVTAGQGQTVRVSGIRIGDIGSVELKEGRAIVELEIDRDYENLVHTDATALLRPKTGLKDMFLELDPGTPSAPVAEEGWTMPVANTQVDVNPDEIFSSLDSDTRDYLKLLVNGAGQGLRGRGGDLSEVLERFEPTHRDLARVSTAVATRRKNLRRLITSLNQLNTELASRDDDLADFVTTSATVLRAFASEDANLSRTVRDLPPALRATTATLGKVERLAEVLRPTADRLRPTARAIDDANRAVRPVARQLTPLIRDDVRPFIRDARPLVRDLRPATADLAEATPDLVRTLKVVNRFFNLVSHNPNGREAPGGADRAEGYLFWLAWLQHMGGQAFSNSDAHGTFRPITLAAPCETIAKIVAGEPQLEFLLGLTPIITSSPLCSQATERAEKRHKATAGQRRAKARRLSAIAQRKAGKAGQN